ncbi:MAG: agmatine deiminase family protein [Chitinivibrionales bacterium]|nr:agmatine deiminase family protein [Chitinivibrionales bacterium]
MANPKKNACVYALCLIVGALCFASYGQQTPRMCAEWEPALGTLIRWPLGIPSSLVIELAKDDSLYVTVASQQQEDEARSQFSSWGVNLKNCVFIRAKTNTHWTRDWGPQGIFDEKGSAAILDPIFKGYPHVVGCSFFENYSESEQSEQIVNHAYRRESSSGGYQDDDAANSFVAERVGIARRQFQNYLTGGNIAVDGMNTAISTRLMIDENAPLCNEETFKNNAKSAMGITNFHIVEKPEIQGIQHIDCYAKFLDEETILLKEVDKNNPEYKCVERLYGELRALKSCYGRPYKISRILCGPYQNSNVAAYTNSLILNRKVLVPFFGIASDQVALETFKRAMPGYTVIGIEYKSWYYYDALHCRTMGIFDPKMLRIIHRSLDTEIIEVADIPLRARIDHRSGAGLIEDKCSVHWRKKGATAWQDSRLNRVNMTDSVETFITGQPTGAEIEYYLSAADSSGRSATLPRSAPDWFFSFTVKRGTAIERNDLFQSETEIRLKTPGNPGSIIRFTLPKNSPARISIYDLSGTMVYSFDLKGTTENKTIEWVGRNSTGGRSVPGIYVAILERDTRLQAQRFMFME